MTQGYLLLDFASLNEEQRASFYDFCYKASKESLPAAKTM